MTSSHITFGSLMATTSSAQSPLPSTAATGTSVSWSVGVEGGNRGGRGGKRSAQSRGPPAAQSAQSSASGYQGASVDWGLGRSAWSRGPPATQSAQSPPASGSQGAGQGNAKGKGKRKRKRNRKSSSTGQSQADNLHDNAQELTIHENGTEESNEEVCFICAEPVKYYSVSTCNHRTCHACALKLRALYEKQECTFCKEPQQSVVVTSSPDKPYEEYELGKMPHRDGKLSIFFETQEMMRETLILLRFNCPDPACDYVGNEWGNLKVHTRTVHNRLMCDLCIRTKKVFAHEHALYPPSILPFHLPSTIQRHQQNAPKEKIEGGVHPMCEFCRECFFGDDELYAHFRERHEECFVCKRNDIRNQYFQNYDSLEQHFQEAHYACTQSQCLARKFVVFGTLLDLKAHMVEEHGGDMSSRDRKDARRIVADFTFDDRHGHGRRDPHRQERDQGREREREPPPSWPPPSPTIMAGPVPRPFQAAGQNRRRKSFGARLTVGDTSTIGESSILASQPAISNRTPTLTREDIDPAFAVLSGALISRLRWLAPNPMTAIPAVRAAMRGYRSSESSAHDLISTIWNILDGNLEHTASIVNEFADLIEEEKKQDLLASWRVFAIEQLRQFPELVPTTVGAAVTTGRGLNAMSRSSERSSRAAWNLVARPISSSMAAQPSAASVASSSQLPTLDRFRLSTMLPSSSSSNHPAMLPSQNQPTTLWASSGNSNVNNYGAPRPSATSHSMAETKVQVVASTVPGSPVSPTTSVSMSGVGVTHHIDPTANEVVSWASLLKPSSPTTPCSSIPSDRNMLLTSSVVGMSFPASTNLASSASSTSAGVSPRNKAELVALLTNGPSDVAAVANNGGAGEMGQLKPRGLVNSGNMCFANSVLQVLVYTIPFQRLFFDIGRLRGTGVGLGKEANDGKDGSASTTPLVDAMVGFVKEFFVTDAELYEGNAWSGNVTASGWGKGKEKERERETGDEDELWGTEPFFPSYVYEAMKEKKRFDDMWGGQQEDAEEFLGFLLETLEEELVLLKETLTGTSPSSSSGRQEVGKKKRKVLMRTIKSTESPISKIFGGKFRTTLKVPHTKKDSVIIEDWKLIRLDIQRDQIHTVQDALAYISQPQPVQVANPARPGTTLEAHQVVHIDALPPVLVLHMNRFCYDASVGGVVKVGKQVTFGPELEIGNEVMSHAIRKSRKSEPTKYELFGVLYHHGLSASGGFYTLDVLHPTRFSSPDGRPREGWIRIYDELASDVRHDDVFGGEEDDNRSAYLLFYRRIR